MRISAENSGKINEKLQNQIIGHCAYCVINNAAYFWATTENCAHQVGSPTVIWEQYENYRKSKEISNNNFTKNENDFNFFVRCFLSKFLVSLKLPQLLPRKSAESAGKLYQLYKMINIKN